MIGKAVTGYLIHNGCSVSVSITVLKGVIIVEGP